MEKTIMKKVMEMAATKKYTGVKQVAETLSVESKEAKKVLDMMVSDGVLNKVMLSRQKGFPWSYTLTEKGKMINSLS